MPAFVLLLVKHGGSLPSTIKDNAVTPHCWQSHCSISAVCAQAQDSDASAKGEEAREQYI